MRKKADIKGKLNLKRTKNIISIHSHWEVYDVK